MSTTMILCDTNIFIEIYRGNAMIIDTVQHIQKENRIVVSDVTRAELFFGAKNKSELHYIRKGLNSFPVLPVHALISTMAVKLVEDYCLSHKLDFLDALIAATAICHDVELYTLNRKDFVFLPLKLYQP